MATPTDEHVVRTLTLPFELKDERPKVSHYHEAKAKDAPRYPGAILVLANSVLEDLGAPSLVHLTVTIQAVKHEGTMTIEPPIEPPPAEQPTQSTDEPKADDAKAGEEPKPAQPKRRRAAKTA